MYLEDTLCARFKIYDRVRFDKPTAHLYAKGHTWICFDPSQIERAECPGEELIKEDSFKESAKNQGEQAVLIALNRKQFLAVKRQLNELPSVDDSLMKPDGVQTHLLKSGYVDRTELKDLHEGDPDFQIFRFRRSLEKVRNDLFGFFQDLDVPIPSEDEKAGDRLKSLEGSALNEGSIHSTESRNLPPRMRRGRLEEKFLKRDDLYEVAFSIENASAGNLSASASLREAQRRSDPKIVPDNEFDIDFDTILQGYYDFKRRQ